MNIFDFSTCDHDKISADRCR